MKNSTLLEKMEYLERKFNAPMDLIIKAINFNKLNNPRIKTVLRCTNNKQTNPAYAPIRGTNTEQHALNKDKKNKATRQMIKIKYKD